MNAIKTAIRLLRNQQATHPAELEQCIAELEALAKKHDLASSNPTQGTHGTCHQPQAGYACN